MIQQSIQQAMAHEDEFMREMGNSMNIKFEKYWHDYSLILGIFVVFYPRYKLAFVEWAYKSLYGENSAQLNTFKDTLLSLFDVYVEKWSPDNASGAMSASCSQDEGEDAFFQVIVLC